jgi:MYXO-CTERM domain-containing protein
MQTKWLTMAFLGTAVFVGARPASGAPVFTVNMDEFGKGTTTLPTGAIIPTPTLVPAPVDPFLPPGFAPTPVVYSLAGIFPGGATSGDLIITEPPVGQQSQSDLLRFFQNLVFVYSDVSTSDPANAPADVGVPPSNNTAGPMLILPEMGPEAGVNGLFGYTPGPGMPGFLSDVGTGGLVWNFTSDTPEPSTLVLAAIGFAGLALIRRRR